MLFAPDIAVYEERVRERVGEPIASRLRFFAHGQHNHEGPGTSVFFAQPAFPLSLPPSLPPSHPPSRPPSRPPPTHSRLTARGLGTGATEHGTTTQRHARKSSSSLSTRSVRAALCARVPTPTRACPERGLSAA